MRCGSPRHTVFAAKLAQTGDAIARWCLQIEHVKVGLMLDGNFTQSRAWCCIRYDMTGGLLCREVTWDGVGGKEEDAIRPCGLEVLCLEGDWRN